MRIGVNLGITKIRVTGGEPLVRKGVYDFLQLLSEIDGISDLSLTTNGILLKENIDRIKSAGIKRINISLDTIYKKKYEKITGFDMFDQVWEGILLAKEAGFDPIKINAVVLTGINDDELTDLAKLSISHPFHIRFIEYMPIGNPRMNYCRHMLTPEIKQRISVLGDLIPVENNTYDGPSQRFKFKGAKGEIGFISPISRHFCDKCNRLRLTANGYLRPCLLSDNQEDLKGPIRKGCLDSDLVDIITRTAYHKPAHHNIVLNEQSGVMDQMFSIGG